jgi:hypothetical protein
MRKYEKIQENIMIMQQNNTKRIEKPIEETPGPNYYEPNYDLVENNGFAVKYFFYFHYKFRFIN